MASPAESASPDHGLSEALFRACASGDAARAEIILCRAAPDPSALAASRDGHQWTALDVAAYGGHLGAARAVADRRKDERRRLAEAAAAALNNEERLKVDGGIIDFDCLPPI